MRELISIKGLIGFAIFAHLVLNLTVIGDFET